MESPTISYWKLSQTIFKCEEESTRALWGRIKNIIDEVNKKRNKAGKSMSNLY